MPPRTKNPYTERDDKLLAYAWAKGHRGAALWKALERKEPRHTQESWKNRFKNNAERIEKMAKEIRKKEKEKERSKGKGKVKIRERGEGEGDGDEDEEVDEVEESEEDDSEEDESALQRRKRRRFTEEDDRAMAKAILNGYEGKVLYSRLEKEHGHSVSSWQTRYAQHRDNIERHIRDLRKKKAEKKRAEKRPAESNEAEGSRKKLRIPESEDEDGDQDAGMKQEDDIASGQGENKGQRDETEDEETEVEEERERTQELERPGERAVEDEQEQVDEDIEDDNDTFHAMVEPIPQQPTPQSSAHKRAEQAPPSIQQPAVPATPITVNRSSVSKSTPKNDAGDERANPTLPAQTFAKTGPSPSKSTTKLASVNTTAVPPKQTQPKSQSLTNMSTPGLREAFGYASGQSASSVPKFPVGLGVDKVHQSSLARHSEPGPSRHPILSTVDIDIGDRRVSAAAAVESYDMDQNPQATNREADPKLLQAIERAHAFVNRGRERRLARKSAAAEPEPPKSYQHASTQTPPKSSRPSKRTPSPSKVFAIQSQSLDRVSTTSANPFPFSPMSQASTHDFPGDEGGAKAGDTSRGPRDEDDRRLAQGLGLGFQSEDDVTEDEDADGGDDIGPQTQLMRAELADAEVLDGETQMSSQETQSVAEEDVDLPQVYHSREARFERGDLSTPRAQIHRSVRIAGHLGGDARSRIGVPTPTKTASRSPAAVVSTDITRKTYARIAEIQSLGYKLPEIMGILFYCSDNISVATEWAKASLPRREGAPPLTKEEERRQRAVQAVFWNPDDDARVMGTSEEEIADVEQSRGRTNVKSRVAFLRGDKDWRKRRYPFL